MTSRPQPLQIDALPAQHLFGAGDEGASCGDSGMGLDNQNMGIDRGHPVQPQELELSSHKTTLHPHNCGRFHQPAHFVCSPIVPLTIGKKSYESIVVSEAAP